MAVQLQRARIRPMWKGGLRRGRERDTMTEYFFRHPEFAEEIRRVNRELDAMGLHAMPMDRVKQPFDYERR
jgi:hypothetical protein